jgi:hypothetical protein
MAIFVFKELRWPMRLLFGRAPKGGLRGFPWTRCFTGSINLRRDRQAGGAPAAGEGTRPTKGTQHKSHTRGRGQFHSGRSDGGDPA